MPEASSVLASGLKVSRRRSAIPTDQIVQPDSAAIEYGQDGRRLSVAQQEAQDLETEASELKSEASERKARSSRTEDGSAGDQAQCGEMLRDCVELRTRLQATARDMAALREVNAGGRELVIAAGNDHIKKSGGVEFVSATLDQIGAVREQYQNTLDVGGILCTLRRFGDLHGALSECFPPTHN